MEKTEHLALELLTSERVLELWPKLKPLLEKACESNEVGQTDISAEDIYMLALTDLAAIFAATVDGEPTCVLGFQFTETNGKKGVSIIALAGKHLMQFKALYWDYILDWFRANGVVFLDVYANERMANIYSRKFGFGRSCVMLRKML